MQQYMIHLNGGYNPFVRLGRGALGYRPNRKMIGRGDRLHHGGGGGGPPSDDEEDNQVAIRTNNTTITTSNNESSDEGSNYADEEEENSEESEEETKEESKEETKEESKEGPITKIKTAYDKATIKAINTSKPSVYHKKLIINKGTEALERLYDKKLLSTLTPDDSSQRYDTIEHILKGMIKSNVDLIDPYNTPMPIVNKLTIIDIQIDNLVNAHYKTQIYKDDLIKNACIKAINYIIGIKTTSLTSDEIALCDALINKCLSKLDDVDTSNTYKIENNSLVITSIVKEKPSVNLEYPLNLQQSEAKEIIEQYWLDNNNTPFILKIEDYYTKETKDIIKKVNKLKLDNLVGKEIDDKGAEIKPYHKLRSKFPNETESKKYMDGITLNGKSYFYDENGNPKVKSYTKTDKKGKRILDEDGNKMKEDLVMIEKEYSMPGKPAEFSICGIDNPFARQFYDVEHPNMQVCDFIVEEITGSSGKSFCIDNVDITNKLFSEMKYYVGINYVKQCNLNRELKLIYINNLKKKIRTYIIKLNDIDYKSKHDSLNTKLANIRNILSKKSIFELAFYKNNNYLGVGVTMNKFATIELPPDYMYNGPSNKDMIDHVVQSQKRSYIPIFNDDRRITKITYDIDDEAKVKNFNRRFNKLIKGKKSPYKYYITCVFKGVVGVYNYTDDDYIDKNFILNSYKCAYAYDDKDHNKFNAVLIPIEKFILKKADSTISNLT